jgi:3-hydroxyacyl-CoA dehydrogenase / enoyl-CoA hydratase / 3-hydroxybutyryl-CoA epimerase
MSTMAQPARVNQTVADEGFLRVELGSDGIAIITFDLPGESVNKLRADFLDGFERVLTEIENNPDLRGAVLASAKKSFIVGADVSMLRNLRSADEAEAMVRRSHTAMERLRAFPKPIVAAIHGEALGGGLEIALACHGRVLSDSPSTQLALPEVQLGLLPGLNGLQRLAELAGYQVALDHGLTGKRIRPDKAKKLGLADDVVPRPILLEVAQALAARLARGERPKRRKQRLGARLSELALERNPLGHKILFDQARKRTLKKTGGHYPAAERIIDVLETQARDGLVASKDVEARAFGELLASEVSKNLMSIFFSTDALKKDNGTADPSVEARPVEKIAMLGAGLMGAGIAYVSIDKRFDVRLKDRDQESVARGLAYVAEILDERVKTRRMTRSERLERLARLTTTVDYDGMRNVDLVIEAVFEDLELKHRVLREVEAHCREGVIFASNTSSIPITRIAEASRAPENVVGMHYFSPVHKMPLLEVIRTARTRDDVVATAVAVGKRQGKTVIVVNDGVGFYTSRILGPYMNEASYLVTEGVPIEAIDRAMVAWGWPVGPLTLLDEVGIDVAAHVGPVMVETFGERMAPPPSIAKLVEDGRKGRKNERGIYLYGKAAKKKGQRLVDPSVYAVLGLAAPDPKRSPVDAEEIQQRCNLQFLNEALHCWGEGILRSARDGDVGAIFGLGFPPFRGGPFRYLDAVGAPTVLAHIERFHDRFGARWTPAPALVELARGPKRIHQR